MQRKGYRFVPFSLAVLTLTTGLSAQTAAPPAGATPSVDAASSSRPVTMEEYLALKRELDQMKQRMDAQDKRVAAATQPATQPAVAQAAPASAPIAAAGGSGPSRSWLILSSNNNDDQVAKSLFAARTDKEYFSPFDIMNPAHMRADMPMQIGQFQDMRLDIGLQTVGRFQALQQQNAYSTTGHVTTNLGGLDPGFQDPFANLTFLAEIPHKLDIYADMYIASRPHASTMYGHEGYILLKQLPAPFDNGPLGKLFDWINIKAGAFDIDFGDDNYRRSNNARVQRNPLIDNPLVDPNVEEIGGEIYSVKGPVYGLFGVASGTTTEHFDYGSQPSFHGKIWGYPCPEVRTSISAYYVDLANSADTSYLYANGRSGGSLASVFGGGDNPGQILPQAGKSVTAVQADLTWNHWPFELYTNVGWTQDSDADSAPPAGGTHAERWVYGAVEPVYHITPALYVAGRYSYALARDINGVETNGWVDRAEVGAGYWITNNLLGKVEYIYEQYHNFGASAGMVSGVDGSYGPRFSGLIVEISFAL